MATSPTTVNWNAILAAEEENSSYDLSLRPERPMGCVLIGPVTQAVTLIRILHPCQFTLSTFLLLYPYSQQGNRLALQVSDRVRFTENNWFCPFAGLL